MKHPALKISVFYVCFSTLYILVSDRILEALVTDAHKLSYLQTTKGWLFVFTTGWLLFAMISRYARERELFARTLVESQERFQMVANATNDVVWDWNLLTNALWWNQNYYALFGYRAEDRRPDLSDWSEHVHPDDRAHVLSSIHGVVQSGASVWSSEYRYARADGSWARIFDRGFVLRNTSNVGYRMVGSMQDITQRKEAEEQILQSQAELRRLTAYVESAREEERTRIAREIHDELGQAMTALKMDVSWLEKKALAEPSTLTGKALTEKTQEMIGLIDETIRTIRRIATELRPGVLDNLGIQAAIEWQAQEFEHHTGIRCSLSVEPPNITLDDVRSTALFRTLQETLTNVARHAHATAVRIALTLGRTDVVLEVRDDGKGISQNDLAILHSFGIIGIRERVSHLGGSVSFSGTPGNGTVVRITLPLEDSHEDRTPNPDR